MGVGRQGPLADGNIACAPTPHQSSACSDAAAWRDGRRHRAFAGIRADSETVSTGAVRGNFRPSSPCFRSSEPQGIQLQSRRIGMRRKSRCQSPARAYPGGGRDLAAGGDGAHRLSRMRVSGRGIREGAMLAGNAGGDAIETTSCVTRRTSRLYPARSHSARVDANRGGWLPLARRSGGSDRGACRSVPRRALRKLRAPSHTIAAARPASS